MAVRKLDRLGRHAKQAVQTQQQKDYDYQLPLPGLPAPAVRLISGYQLDATGEAIERIVDFASVRPVGPMGGPSERYRRRCRVDRHHASTLRWN